MNNITGKIKKSEDEPASTSAKDVLSGALEGAGNAIGKGVSAVRGTVSNVALESSGFVKGFTRMCDNGYAQGWHERNGGNASYRLSDEDLRTARTFLNDEADVWSELGVSAPACANAFFLVTAAGSYMSNVAANPKGTCGIVEINPQGSAYRVRWGFHGGGLPTSEFAGHVLIHDARMQATDGAQRVVYHAHPASVIALSKVVPLDAKALTRELWGAMTECVIAFPDGVGFVGNSVPGSLDLARASADAMQSASAVVWANHGLLCAGDSFDDAFSLMQAIAKAAEICVTTRLLTGSSAGSAGSSASSAGSSACANVLTDADIQAIAKNFDLAINEEIFAE